jgi:hypothetical protein
MTTVMIDEAIKTQNAMLIISKRYEVYMLFGFTIYLMHLADYLKRKKSKKKDGKQI